MTIERNQLVAADFLPGPVRVKRFEERGSHVVFEGVAEETRRYLEKRLTPLQAGEVEVLEEQGPRQHSDADAFSLFLEAHRVRLAHRFNTMAAVDSSKIDPIPHQIEAVYGNALQQPKMRFMIADDAGAGKTIMAGLIIKEMMQRGQAERVLIVSPGHLKYQWRRELGEKFGLDFTLVERGLVRAITGDNVWQQTPHAIASVDFAKQDDIKDALESVRWDLVIVDEAHKLAAYTTEKDGRQVIDRKTQRYQVGEVLSERSEHMLFLTATPHKGKEGNFRLLLDLLQPGLFSSNEILRDAIARGENPLFIRRLKEDMRDFEGKPLFPTRNVKTLQFRLTEAEQRLYNEVTHYVQEYFDLAKDERHISFAMLILQRRLTSSVHAIYSSLVRRREKLGRYLEYPDQIQSDEYEGLRHISEEELEDLPEEERWEIEEKLQHLTIAQNIDQVEEEIEQVEQLIEHAEAVRAQETESKLAALRDEVLETLEGRKLLIFTEHKDTLFYLRDRLRDWGYTVNTIHGSMSQDQRVEQERVFEEETQIMIATEAAGEGINLQFCSLMVNYDIPWNPNRLEQRMGRIHRYGQDREVFIYNLISRDTREGDLLNRLFTKLDRMQQDLGTDRVFDIIGDVVPGTDIGELIRDALFNQRGIEEIGDEIERVDQSHVQMTLDFASQNSLVSELDLDAVREEREKAQRNRLRADQLQRFILRGLDRYDGSYEALKRDRGAWRIDTVPYDWRKYNDRPAFRDSYGRIEDSYRRVTFDKELAKENDWELLGPGHPMVEALNESILGELGSTRLQYGLFRRPDGPSGCLYWFVEGGIVDGTGEDIGRRIFCVRHEPREGGGGERFRRTDPTVLWELEPVVAAADTDTAGQPAAPPELAELLDRRDALVDFLFEDALVELYEDLAEKREYEAGVKERYGVRSLRHLIQESTERLLRYEMENSGEKDMSLPIRNEERKKSNLEQRLERLEEQIRRERSLTIDEPDVIGAAMVV